MVLTREQLSKMEQAELIEYCLKVGDIGAKLEELESTVTEKLRMWKEEFDGRLEDFKKHEKVRFDKVESELSMAKNANKLLREECENRSAAIASKLVDIERTAEKTSQYTQYETQEISGVPSSIPDSDVQQTVLEIINMILPEGESSLDNSRIQACHRRGGKYARGRILLKLVNRPDVHAILKRRIKLKDAPLTDIDERLTSPIYINEHLTPYYAKLRYNCKQLWDLKLIGNYWVSGYKVKLQLPDMDNVHIITHRDDFRELLPTADLSVVYGIK